MKRTERTGVAAPAGIELFPIRTVSSLTGVNSITLRAWERRYGLVQPIRTPTGHRLYRRDEIDLIHRVVALLQRGISISQVRRVLQQQADEDAPAASPEEQTWARFRQRMATAIMRFDEEMLDDAYNEALGVASIEQVTQHLLVPLVRELAPPSRTSPGSVAENRFFGFYLRNKLGARFHHRTRRNTGPRFLATSLPGESHEHGLLLFALTAHEAGLRSVLLGAETPLSELPIAASRAQCQAIVVGSCAEPTMDIVTKELPKLTAAVSVPVFVFGASSIRYRDELIQAGALPMGDNHTSAVNRILETLSNRAETA